MARANNKGKQMTEYAPHNWVLIKIKNKDGYAYKVLGGWSGGYLEGNSWRLNSGIEKVEEDDEYYYFHGSSGSVYKCFKESECIRMNISGILSRLVKLGAESVKITEEIIKDIGVV